MKSGCRTSVASMLAAVCAAFWPHLSLQSSSGQADPDRNLTILLGQGSLVATEPGVSSPPNFVLGCPPCLSATESFVRLRGFGQNLLLHVASALDPDANHKDLCGPNASSLRMYDYFGSPLKKWKTHMLLFISGFFSFVVATSRCYNMTI